MNVASPVARSIEMYPDGWKIRSRRTRSLATRELTTDATAPPANSTRALTISRCGDTIDTPLARTSTAGAPPTR